MSWIREFRAWNYTTVNARTPDDITMFPLGFYNLDNSQYKN